VFPSAYWTIRDGWEDAEELIVREDQAGLLANFALERVSQGFVIFHPSGHERPSGWIESPVEQERTISFDQRRRSREARAIRLRRTRVLEVEARHARDLGMSRGTFPHTGPVRVAVTSTKPPGERPAAAASLKVCR
jgi:hypothetical protein